jgi:hypothetical protein
MLKTVSGSAVGTCPKCGEYNLSCPIREDEIEFVYPVYPDEQETIIYGEWIYPICQCGFDFENK